MQLIAFVVHAVGVLVSGAAEVNFGEALVTGHDPRLPPVVRFLGLESLPALAHVERVLLLVLGPIRHARLVRDCDVLPGVRLELRDPVRDRALNLRLLPGLLVRVAPSGDDLVEPELALVRLLEELDEVTLDVLRRIVRRALHRMRRMIGGVPVLLRGKARTHGERWGWNRVSSWLS